MGYKHIVVHIDANQDNSGRTAMAIALAERHSAHLTGLYVIPPIMMPTYDAIYIPAKMIEDQEQAADLAAEKAQAEFSKAIANASCPTQWQVAKGLIDHHINALSLLADLVIVGQAEQRSFLANDVLNDEYVVIGSHCPVVVVPYIGAPAAIGQRIMVAWNGSREASRAVRGALPLLRKAESVDVVCVNPKQKDGDLPSADICQFLARHSVTATGSDVVGTDIGVGNVLLSRAADKGTDLIVMGAYGHARIRETLLGGVTQTLLEQMTVPVLMAH